MTHRQHLHLIIALVSWGLILAFVGFFVALGKALQ